MNIAVTVLGLAARFARRRIERAREEAIRKALADLASRPRPTEANADSTSAPAPADASNPTRRT